MIHKRARMKMKIWQKMFLIIFTSIAVLFNFAVFTIVTMCYKQQLKREKERALAEDSFVCASLYKDMEAMSDGGILNNERVIQNFEVYHSYYESQGIILELWNGDICYTKTPYELTERKELNLQEEYQNLLIRNIEDTPYLFVAGKLTAPYENYAVVFSYSLISLKTLRVHILQITLGIDILMLAIIMLVLFLIVKRMMSPLERLSKATAEIAAGDYQKKIELHGEDEFVQLANQFNQMSESISTQIKQLEFENETRQNLIDNMAHELRTPLTAILGYAEYIKLAKIDEEEKREVLDYIIHQVNRLKKLSNTLLQLARLREEEPEYEELKVDEFIRSLSLMFKNRVREKKIELKFEKEIEKITANQELLVVLLENLIENAVRACEERGRILVQFKQENNRTMILVRDNGIGMNAAEIEKIDQPFYRVDKDRSRKNGGVGLGVTLCKQIAEYHHAVLSYSSKEGEGTTAKILFSAT